MIGPQPAGPLRNHRGADMKTRMEEYDGPPIVIWHSLCERGKDFVGPTIEVESEFEIPDGSFRKLESIVHNLNLTMALPDRYPGQSRSAERRSRETPVILLSVGIRGES